MSQILLSNQFNVVEFTNVILGNLEIVFYIHTESTVPTNYYTKKSEQLRARELQQNDCPSHACESTCTTYDIGEVILKYVILLP